MCFANCQALQKNRCKSQYQFRPRHARFDFEWMCVGLGLCSCDWWTRSLPYAMPSIFRLWIAIGDPVYSQHIHALDNQFDVINGRQKQHMALCSDSIKYFIFPKMKLISIVEWISISLSERQQWRNHRMDSKFKILARIAVSRRTHMHTHRLRNLEFWAAQRRQKYTRLCQQQQHQKSVHLKIYKPAYFRFAFGRIFHYYYYYYHFIWQLQVTQ